MYVRRTQSGKTRIVRLSLVVNEISRAHLVGILTKVRRDGETITVWTRAGIEVSYTFPEPRWVRWEVADLFTEAFPNQEAQIRWLAVRFTRVTDITDEHIAREGTRRVTQALLAEIDEIFVPGTGFFYHQALELLS